MSVCLSVCMSASLFFYLRVCDDVCLSVYLSICLFVCLSAFPSLLSLNSFVSRYSWIPICIRLYLSIFSLVPLKECLHGRVSVCLPSSTCSLERSIFLSIFTCVFFFFFLCVSLSLSLPLSLSLSLSLLLLLLLSVKQ